LIFKEDGSVVYTLRRSTRAKSVRLKVTRARGLEVVVPEKFKEEWLPSILRKRERWLRQAAEKLSIHLCSAERPVLIPSSIELKAISQSYNVKRVPNSVIQDGVVDASMIIRTSTGALSIVQQDTILLPDSSNDEECMELLRYWLIRCGKEYLPQLLEEAAERVEIPFRKVQVRLQKGRWGSCSSRGTISLNARLLLLPFQLLEYILLHELAHVRHPNHSKVYWDFLNTLEPRSRELDAAMHDVWKYIPTCFAM